MRTQLSGGTQPLEITYSAEIHITSDLVHFYILGKDNNRIDKYFKSSSEKLWNITHPNAIEDLVGKLNFHTYVQ